MKLSPGDRADTSLLQEDYASPGSSRYVSAGPSRYASPPAGADTSLLEGIDTSLAAAADTSLVHGKDTSPPGVADLSPRTGSNASPSAAGRACAWCRAPIVASARADTLFCSRKCRQRAFRIRRRLKLAQANESPMRFAYADPPYPGMSDLYRDQPTYAGEVDHAELVASLEASYDGFAVSTSARALRDVLPLFKRDFRVCAWVKPIGVSGSTFGIHNTWEPLIVVPGRELRPGKRDWLAAQPARRGGSDLIGRKPEAFCTWMFALLGMLPGDTLDDLFPGSGIVGRAWAELCRKTSSTTS